MSAGRITSRRFVSTAYASAVTPSYCNPTSQPSRASRISAAPPPDAVLLTVKAYDTAAAVKALAPFHDASMFVSLQNGLGNEEIIARRAPKVLGAVINLGAVFLGPGDVFHTGSAGIDLGPFAGTDANDAAIVAEAFQETGLKGHAVPNVGEKIWAEGDPQCRCQSAYRAARIAHRRAARQ